MNPPLLNVLLKNNLHIYIPKFDCMKSAYHLPWRYAALLFASFLSSVSLLAQGAFYTETFGDSTRVVSQWKHGGTNPGSEKWRWSKDPSGVFQGQPAFASQTATNGFMVFNSDANGENAHDVFLTSPAINCTGQSKVFLRFENQYAYFSSPTIAIAQVGVSTDSVNFVYTPVLTTVNRNDVSQSIQVQSIELPSAANQPKVFIRFRWQGNFEYFWRIDDISLTSINPQANYDLSVSDPLVAINFATPISQVDTMFAIGVIENKGLLDQNNVTLKMDVSSTNPQTYSKTETISLLKSAAKDTFLLDNLYVPADTGVYTVKFQVKSAQTDQDSTNNTLNANFLVTQNLFSKDDGRITNATQPQSVSGDLWEIGNFYEIVQEGYQAYEATFSVASQNNSHHGKSVSLLLYKVVENADAEFTDADLQIVGYGFHSFTNEANFTVITTPLLDLNTNETGVKLEKDFSYILVVQYAPDMYVPYSTFSYRYNAIATVVKNGQWYLGGFGDAVTAMMRMRIRKNPVTSVVEPQLAESQLDVFPNPADRDLQVDLELQQLSKVVQVQIADVAGRILMNQQYEDIQQHRFQFDVSNLANGTYFLHARTDEGIKTKRFIIQR